MLVQTGHLDRSFPRLLANLQKDREDGDDDRTFVLNEEAARSDSVDAHAFCRAVGELLQREGWLSP